MRQSTRAEALNCWPPFPGCTEPYFDHRYEHVKHVEVNAKKLHGLYGGDLEVILASVWVHDRAKFQGDHAKKAAQWARENLAATGFPAEKVEAVAYAVEHHGGWEIVDSNRLQTMEAQILWDADKLAHCGPAYILDLYVYFTSRKTCERDKRSINIQFHESISSENFLAGFAGFVDGTRGEREGKLFYFPASKEMAAQYRETTRMFYENLTEQWR